MSSIDIIVPGGVVGFGDTPIDVIPSGSEEEAAPETASYGLPRITFNGKNIDFTRPPTLIQVIPVRSRTRQVSASGKPETNSINSGYSVRALFANLQNKDATEGDLKLDLFEASQWAEEGQEWVFMVDRTITTNTTLDGTAAAGASSIPVVNASGITAGRQYVIERADEVASVEALDTDTDPVSITRTLNYGFGSGSRFRYFYYLPMLGSIRVSENYFNNLFDVEIVGEVDRRNLS